MHCIRSKGGIGNKKQSTAELRPGPRLQKYEPLAGNSTSEIRQMVTRSMNIENRKPEIHRSVPISTFYSGYRSSPDFSLNPNPNAPNFDVLKDMSNSDSATKSSCLPTATVSSVTPTGVFGSSMSRRRNPNRTAKIVTMDYDNAKVSNKSSSYKTNKRASAAVHSRFSLTIAGNEKVSKVPISGNPGLHSKSYYIRSKKIIRSVAIARSLEDKNEYKKLIGRIQEKQLAQYPKFAGIHSRIYTRLSKALIPAFCKKNGRPIFKTDIRYNSTIEKMAPISPTVLSKSHESHEFLQKMFGEFNRSDDEKENENLSMPISTPPPVKYSSKSVGRKLTRHRVFPSRQKSYKELQLYSAQTKSSSSIHGHTAKKILHNFRNTGFKSTQSKPNAISPPGNAGVIKVGSSSSRTSVGSSTDVMTTDNSENEKESSDSDSDIEILAESIICPMYRNSLELETFESLYKDKRWSNTLSSSFQQSQQSRLSQVYVEKKTMQILNTESDMSAELSKKSRSNLTLNDIIVPEEKEPGLPAMTDEMCTEVERIMNSKNNEEVLVTAFNIEITRGDLKTLTPSQWLNDNVINTYMEMIAERSRTEKGKLPTVYVFSTFFFPKLLKDGYSNVLKRWTKKVDIFTFNLLIFPIHLGVHWCLAVADMRNKTICYYDSLLSKRTKYINKAILKYLRFEMKERKKIELKSADWKLKIMRQIPTQESGSDCGMFTCKFAEYLSRDASLTFEQSGMEYYRKRMIYEIMHQDLLCP